MVALPLALAFGIASGLGATAGLVTAVVAGTVAAIFGGSHVQVSGPTGAMTVVLVPIVAEHGPSGVAVVALMAGVFLVAMGLAGAGRYVRFIPLPVIEGFTLGIAALIALQQVPAALGTTGQHEHVVVSAVAAVVDWFSAPDLAALALSAGVAVLILLGSRLRPAVPVALLAVVAATVVSRLAHLQVATIGALPSQLFTLTVPSVTWSELRVLVAPAVAVAALAALESLLSATVADAMSVSTRHDPDRELFGQGLANLASPLLGGIPATAAIARTAVNVRSGARSRLAAVVHSLVLLVVVLALAPVVGWIPLAALAGVLIATAVRMVEVSSLRALVRVSRSDAFVLALTFLATVVLDLATAVVLGIVTAGALALRQLANTTALREEPLAEVDGSRERRASEGDHGARGACPARRAHRGVPPRGPALLRRGPHRPARAHRGQQRARGDPADVARDDARRHGRGRAGRHGAVAGVARRHRAAVRAARAVRAAAGGDRHPAAPHRAAPRLRAHPRRDRARAAARRARRPPRGGGQASRVIATTTSSEALARPE